MYVDFVCTPRFFAAFLLAALCLTGLSPLAASASPREGTVEWMLMQPIGTPVTLDTMIVEQVGTDHVLLREPFAYEHVVFVDCPAQVKKWQSVEARGTVALDSSSRKYLADARVYAYTDSCGEIILCPLPKPVDRRIMWAGTMDVTLSASYSSLSLCSTPPMPSDPGTSPTSASTGWRTPLAAIKALSDGTVVEVRNKWVSGWDSNGDTWIEEADRSAGVKVKNIAPYNDELVSFTATVTTEAGQKVLNAVEYSAQSPPTDVFAPAPFGIPNYAVWGPQLESSGSGRSPGISNLGLLVTVWGKVEEIGVDQYGYPCLAIDDGSGVKLRSDLIGYDFDLPDANDYVAITGVVDVVYRAYSGGISPDGLSWPEGWCRRVVASKNSQVVIIDLQNPVQGTARPQGNVTVNLQAGEQIDVPVHVYTQYGHVVVEPNQWSGGSGSYSASCSLAGVPGDATHAGLLSVKAAGYASVSNWAYPGSSVTVVLSNITGGTLAMTDPNPSMVMCGGTVESSIAAIVKDAEGVCVPGEDVEWSVTNGEFTHNHLQTALVTTDENGLSTVSVSPTAIGNIKVTASWSGLSVSKTVSLAAERISLWTLPALVSGQTSTIYAKLMYDEEPWAGAYITFTAVAGGNVNGQSGVQVQTAENGIAQVTFAGDGTAEPKVTATFTNACGWSDSVTLDADQTKSWPMFHRDIALTGVTPAIIPTNLAKKWELPMAGNSSGMLWSSPVVANGWVYVGTNNPDGTLYAIKTDGTDAHSVDLGSPIHGTPCVGDGNIYIGTENGVLHVLQTQTLAPLWSKAFPGEKITGSATVYNGVVYIGTGSIYTSERGWLHAINIADHSEICGDESQRHTRTDVGGTTPAIDVSFGSGMCYVSDFSCWVTAFGCDDGTRKWEWAGDTAAMFASPVLHNSYIFAGSSNNCIYRLSETTGTCQVARLGSACKYAGTFVTGNEVRSTAAAWDGRLYFGCNDGKLYCVDANTMQQPSGWPIDLQSGPVISSPLISSPNGLLFAATRDGRIVGINIQSGAIFWNYRLRVDDNWNAATVLSSPAAAGDRLYIVAGDETKRKLYCFGQEEE